MPVEYYAPTAVPIIGMPTYATTATNPIWLWCSANTNATTATSTVTNWVWLDTGTMAVTMPSAMQIYAHAVRRSESYERQWITPRRLAIARRSYQQAMEAELHDFYRQEERRQRAELARHSEAAMARSRELLLEHLTPAQRETFERNKWFVIEGGKSRQRYRIRAVHHMVANVDVIRVADDGTEVVSHRLCAHCRLDEVPLFDQLLAQKLMLEFDEERFLSLANHHRPAA